MYLCIQLEEMQTTSVSATESPENLGTEELAAGYGVGSHMRHDNYHCKGALYDNQTVNYRQDLQQVY